MPIKSLPFEFKASADARTFEGYASTYSKDLVGDQIMQGAFRKTINERHPLNQIKILWQHNEPIGLPIRIEEDSKGLYVHGKISKTRLGDEALELMRDRVVDAMSIGYDVVKDSLSDDGSTRLLHELKLYEVSPVTFPANPDTTIIDVKRFDYDAVELQKLLKAGRVLSAANAGKLQSILLELTALLSTAEPPEGTHTEPPKGTQSVGIAAAFSDLLNEMKSYRRA